MSTVASALLWSAAMQAVTTGVSTYVSREDQQKALDEQKRAQDAATQKQEQADREAEQKRLEGIAANQAATGYGNIWGTDGAKYKDAAQKLSAGTGSFNTDDDETNPFYARGLL